MHRPLSTPPIEELVRLAKIRWWVEHDDRELKLAWAWVGRGSLRLPFATQGAQSQYQRSRRRWH